MSITCPVDLNTAILRAEISSIYGKVADNPEGEFHFHRGPAYAAEFLGYDAAELALLPADCTASFAGIGNPLAIGPINPGETVLDIGCGAGMDLLLLARRVGPTGRAIGVDMTDAMINRARKSADASSLSQVEIRMGDATALPLGDNSIDVVSSNGVLNLVPEKEKGFAEIIRVLRPGGRLHLADIALDVELPEDARRNIDLWTGWIAGALPEAEIIPYLTQIGLADVRITARFDCFRATSKERTARKYGVHGVNVFAHKPVSDWAE